ncbi:MAG: hypothetical protein DWQ44_03470 [Bacteroidetes bacterium]|mgnify:CR=1 FL=1|nr:MAG: hypothetical protein DWQ33_04330 [Bacteroidota bacterium]REJ99946.1 MAG: hypothetical protein DWQ39_13605 [Bacteroidota bacterium]REK35874.1 MAG: hypothetical protein DWQ44_03470 [Bacteroidota bacterium]REK50649.1 MAG: hypothetical protein DWQ48_04895 [Bacteroidota bacterium]
MIRIKIISIVFLALLGFNAKGQSTKSFSTDPSAFLSELKIFLVETDKKEGEKLIETFTPLWGSGRFSQSQQKDIIKTGNAMLKKRMKAFPDFKNYINSLISFAQSDQSSQSFDAWQASIDKLLALPARHFSNYINVCNFLFQDRSLYVSPSTRWYTPDGSYSFGFDSIPKIDFGKMTLICTAKSDSSVIYSTAGSLYPTLNLFIGKGGRVNWIRAGFDEQTVRADLNDYKIDVSGSDWSADSVVFVNSVYFNKPLIGTYRDKILANVTPDKATYPRFESHDLNLVIKNIVPDLDYSGGFSMVGNKMVGSGNDDENAKLLIKREGKPFLLAASRGFVVRKERITSDNASVTIFHEQDSIYHPSLSFKYIVQDREVALIRGEDGKSKSPYFNSYHQIDMYFDGLYWKIDDPIINMKMISGEGESKATFESSNYFRKNRFLKLQSLSEVHPLFRIKQYTERRGSPEIYTEDLAKEMKLSVNEVRTMLINLSNQGFVTYDSKNDMAIAKDRLNYYLLANTGKIDYDVLMFESVISAKPNASINLLNFEITMRGLAPIILSDSQNVVIYPGDQEIKMKKNRDFAFTGRVKAGRFDFYGKQFTFDYHNFKINLDNVDSLRLKVESDNPQDVDEYGNRRLVNVRSVLQNINGDLLIDYQGNKSGLHNYPEYPVFNSKKDSYVYYDRKFIQNGVYDKDRFYFHLDPFTIDSLDNFSRAGLRFDGEFVSAGIFPDFRDTLRLQKDLSLGLTRTSGPEGWPAYGGKGQFTNTINLSNAGLHGNGTLDYLTSTSKSDDFLFLPDSMNSSVKLFENRKEIYKGIEFPEVFSPNVYVHWQPYNDVMYVNRKIEDMTMYENQAQLNGNLQLKPSGMTGNGVMSFAASELESKMFKYKSNTFGADTSDFRLTSDNTAALAFTTKNVNSHIDFTRRVGEFKSNGGGSYVSFPLNQYICFIDQFKWFMDQQEIELSSGSSAQVVEDTLSTGLSLTGSEFISVDPRQDSLRFKAPFAKYSLKDYLIKAEQVALVYTADAAVIPDSGKLVIERYAKMRTLENARIVANNTTKYHTIYNAKVNILGRKKYEGSGDYDYVDENRTKHHFHFNNVRVDSTLQTIADGELNDTSGFPLSNHFLFKGSVHLLANKQFLEFSGFTMPNIQCGLIERNWIRFRGEINPDNVSVPVNSPITDTGAKLAAAVAQTSDTTGIYAAFLMPKKRATDLELINASGVLFYNKETNQFRITTAEKRDKPLSPGNYLSLDDASCKVFGEGKISFGADLGQLSMTTVGNLKNDLKTDSTEFDLLMVLDFPFADDALKSMSEFLSTNAMLKPTQDIGRLTFEKGLAEIAGKEKADKMIAELNLYGAFKKIPDELRHTFFFTELKMAWNNDLRAYRSIGQIGVSNMDKTSINRRMNGHIEILRKRSGDSFTIYLEPENGTWYYFSYSRGLMQAISSSSVFNEAIEKLKPEKRVSKVKDKPDFEYILSTDRAVRNFLKKLSPADQSEN